MTNHESQAIDHLQTAGDDRHETAVPRLMLILIAITVLTSAASLMVSRDMLVRDQTHTTLQVAADRAAMAGAAYLPGWPTRAVRAAEQSVELSGFERSSMVDATVAPNRMSLRVALKCAAPVLLLRIFNDGAVSVVSMAGAPQSKWRAIFNRFAPDGLETAVSGTAPGRFAPISAVASLSPEAAGRDVHPTGPARGAPHAAAIR